MYGLVERGQRDAGTNGLEETALAQHHLATGLPVGGYGTIGYGQVLDGHIGHKLHDGLDDAGAFDDVVEAEREVRQFEHLLPVDGLHPIAERLELACGIDAADEGTHRTAGDGGDVIPLGLKLLNSTDVGKSPRATTRQY